MFIGQILQPWARSSVWNTGFFGTQSSFSSLSKQLSQLRYDRVELNTRTQTATDAGIYRPAPNLLTPIPYPEIPVNTSTSPDLCNDEKYWIIMPSDLFSMTEDEALLNQYMKRYRFEGYWDNGEYVATYMPPGLRAPSNVTQEELESFRKELIENGLGEEIDWSGVSSDLDTTNITYAGRNLFAFRTDYIASRYAVLKDRILTQFTGDKQTAELQKLEQIYTNAKNRFADYYAKSIGGFYEDLGQSGTAEDMRSSVLAVIDGKVQMYSDYLEQNDIYADITDPDQQWLKQDDGYMAGKLREEAAAASLNAQSQAVPEQTLYNEQDLIYAVTYAETLSHELRYPSWYYGESSYALGMHFANQYETLKDDMQNQGISDKLSDVSKNVFVQFMEKYMDKLDAQIEHINVLLKRPFKDYIDRELVLSTFQNMISDNQ